MQHFCDSKGGGPVQAYHKPKRTEQLYPISSFQDGRAKGSTPSSSAGGLVGKTGPQGRIFFSSPGDQVPKICPFSAKEQTLRVPLPGIRFGAGSKNLHQGNESTHIPPKKDRCSTGDLPGRPSNLCLFQGGTGEGKGLSNVSLLSPGADHKLEKISPHPIPKTGVSGDNRGQFGNVIFPVREENGKVDLTNWLF